MAHYKGAAAEATRAMHIMKKREQAREELEMKKRRVEEDVKLSTIDNKFATHHQDAIEAQLKTSTVGLVTLDQMRRRQVDALREREKQLAQKVADDTKIATNRTNQDKTSIKKNKTLSFGHEDDEDEDEDECEDEYADDDDKTRVIGEEEANTKSDMTLKAGSLESTPKTETTKSPSLDGHDDPQKIVSTEIEKKSCIRKKGKPALVDLDMDTCFLPDREREEEERKLREKLATEWRERQQKLKEEDIEITFSYWDGSGHRRVVRMKKGNSIYQFLQSCLETLRKDFNELRSVSADHLMYVKEDLIIPHHYTFYDFIVTKARGKSGPLFSFDVHEDIRLIADASVEKDESHAGKVLLRSWYERNKHIFPASRWEPYDPTKSYEKYTISDKRAK